MNQFIFLPGPIGKDGNECPIFCPAKCDESIGEIHCPGEGEDANGCPTPDFCMPVTPDCPNVSCPVKCSPDEMTCPGGLDHNWCPMPDTCIPMKGNK